MPRQSWLIGPACIALCALAAGCGSTAHSVAPSAAAVRSAFAGSPAPLAALHAQGNELVASNASAFQARLTALRGFPVVINKWASWCGPCRQEFPSFQRASVSFGRRVAFLGLDSFDNNDNARGFLRQFPVTYPSFEDGNDKIANALHAGAYFPTTLFLDASGKLAFLHQGPYTSAAALAADISRYALHRA